MVKICQEPYTQPALPSFNQFPFELDDFQKYTIEAIEKNHHVLNTAHTGSGKTLGAEYIIQKFCSQGKKVIYTAPIKSLSNQKFHEFSQKFPNISFGVLTGDIKFNPEADCLIMTTEILRNFLFHQFMPQKDTFLYFSMDLDNLSWVIFDEVHYINDSERGKVWEESIMMLPEHVRLLMLSATIDNAVKFAKWVEDTKKSEVWLASTDVRVVPLTHYSFLTLRSKLSEQHGQRNSLIDNSLHKPVLLRKHNGSFQDQNFVDIHKLLQYFEKNKLFVNRKFILNSVMKYLFEHNLLPAIFFVFSRKKAEEYAKSITLSLLDGKSMNLVANECKQILIQKLPNYKEYIQLPEYTSIVRLLTKGIAIHHSGIHPVFKEMIELMFSRGFIKALFATETFAVGINMPTKSVVFTSLQKFDGSNFRYLLPHEYTQMAGRAGRRGLDKEGHVFHLNNMFPLPSLAEYKQILCGKAVRIESKFSIHYNLLLRLMSIQCNDFKGYINQSMLQDNIDKEVSYIKEQIGILEYKKERKRENLQYCRTPVDTLEQFVDLEYRMTIVDRKTKKKLWKTKHILLADHKHIEKESQKIRDIRNIEEELQKYQKELQNTNMFISNEINTILAILEQHDFIKNKSLTMQGLIASTIQEVHCLVFGKLLERNRFNNLTTRELICVLSCFSNISIPQDDRMPRPKNIPLNLQVFIEEIQFEYNHFYQIEMDNYLSHGQQYNMHFELCEAMYQWCDATNEQECKAVYQAVAKKGIFLGEFIKTILKIANIANEFEKVCELQCNLTLLDTVKQIPALILKSVATNQSLYL